MGQLDLRCRHGDRQTPCFLNGYKCVFAGWVA